MNTPSFAVLLVLVFVIGMFWLFIAGLQEYVGPQKYNNEMPPKKLILAFILHFCFSLFGIFMFVVWLLLHIRIGWE